jgi:glutathione S-transferase
MEPSIITPHLKYHPGPRAMQGWIDDETTMNVLAAALAKGPFLLGDSFTAPDVVIGAGLTGA